MALSPFWQASRRFIILSGTFKGYKINMKVNCYLMTALVIFFFKKNFAAIERVLLLFLSPRAHGLFKVI